MQKNRKNRGKGSLFLGIAAAAMLLVMMGCPSSTDDDPPDPNTKPPNSNLTPLKPVFTSSQTGFELADLTVDSQKEENQKAVVSFTWTGEGATEYNIYWDEESVPPKNPKDSGIRDTTYFAKGLKPNTNYYFWVEGVNSNGKTKSDFLTKKTGQTGTQASGGLERGDYPHNIKVVPGSGSLTVSWDLSDRVGWYEVYYTPKNAVPHPDIWATRTFPPTDPKYTGVAYGGSPVHAFMPDSPEGYTGYYIRPGNGGVDGDRHPIVGIDELKSELGNTVFYKIKEIWDAPDADKLVPYKKLDPAFAAAIPWDGTKNGPPGTSVKFYGTSTTITGLTNGTAYDVWIRSPNANGERGYGYITGIPGAGEIQTAVSGITVTTPANTAKNLNVTWNKLNGADKYRIYTGKFDTTPKITDSYDLVEGTKNQYTIGGLDINTTYYVWVVAEKNGFPGPFGTSVSGKTGTAPSVGKSGDKLIKGTSEKVKTLVYVEVNDHNPLNAGSYILEDGTYLFDYVVLFAANIRDRNCAANSSANAGCQKNGVHVHFNENVRHILSSRGKYIQPLQDKGIKVLLGLLGDHDGIGFASMTDAQRNTFITDLKDVINRYNLDGVDFDDEWASKEDWDNWTNSYKTISPNSIWTYPTSSWGWPTTVTVYRDPSKGIVAGNGILTAPSAADMTRMWLESGVSFYKTLKAARDNLPGKIVTLYEYNTGRYITQNGVSNGGVTRDQLLSTVDFALQPWYDQYYENSANGLPRNIYSPFGMDLGGQAYSSQNGAPNPPITVNGNNTANRTIYDYATRFKTAADSKNPYNVLYFYALRPASDLLKRQSNESKATVTKEEYISIMSEIIFGQKVVLTAEGGNYRKDW